MFTPIETSVGALLLHQATSTLLLNNGRVLGASSILGGSIFSPSMSNVPVILGMGIATAGASLFAPGVLPSYDVVQEIFGPWTGIIAGLVVGVGTKLGSGCTSGHMLCGLARLSPRSFVATSTFFLTSVLTTTLLSTAPGCSGLPCYTPTFPSKSTAIHLLALLLVTSITSNFLIPRLPSNPFSRALVSAYSGTVFGLGLLISQMASPSKTLGFLSLPFTPNALQKFDPSLALIIVFGIIPNYFSFSRSKGPESKPLLEEKWLLPTKKDIDARLIIGAALFGVGWGFTGVCPGPGIIRGMIGGYKGLTWLVGFLMGWKALEFV
ncbi:hypothetical protein RUND412_008686 [Rhizina undulata]